MQPRVPCQSSIGALRTALLLLTLLVAACSSGNMDVDPPRARVADEDAGHTNWEPASRRLQSIGCSEGDVRGCSYYLPEHNGVRPCIVGYQVCSDDRWSHCTEGVPQDAGADRRSDAGATSGD